jgi:hypothetical protein
MAAESNDFKSEFGDAAPPTMTPSLADISDQIGYPHASTKPRRFYTLYDQYFADLADRPVTMLELGVYTGESVKVFASFFKRGRVIGVDIEDRGVDLSGYPNAASTRSAPSTRRACPQSVYRATILEWSGSSSASSTRRSGKGSNH